MSECLVETEVAADIAAIYRHLFGIKGQAIGPQLDQRQLSLVYDLSARGKLSASLTTVTDIAAATLNATTQTAVFQNSTQGIFTLASLSISLTAAANHVMSLRYDSFPVWIYSTTYLNPIISILPNVVTEYAAAQPVITSPGPGDMWAPGDSQWSLQVNAGGVGDVVTVISQTYNTPYGVEPP